MKFLDIFLRRPRIAAAFSIVALIVGVLSFLSLPRAFLPTVARPVINVSCNYPGANAREVMNTVAGPIEDLVNGVEGFNKMTSTCADTGSYSLQVYFQTDYDRDVALMKVQAKVQQALTQLPQEVKNTGVTVGIGQNIDLGWITLYSERGEISRDEIVDYMYGVVSPAIQRVQGVGASSVQDEKIAMRVWLDSDRMASLGINTEEVVAAVKAQNVQASLGTVGSSPTEDRTSRVLSLVAKGRLTTAEEFGSIIVRTAKNGGLVYLRDISRIGLGHERYAHYGMYGDRPACSTHLYQLPGADTLRTVERIKDCLRDLETRFPGDLRWDMTVDVSRYSVSALKGAAISLVLAALVAFLVLMAVFRSLRTPLVALLTALVPLSLVVAVLAAGGYFITVLTLYALAVSIAFLIGIAAYVMIRCREGRIESTRLPVLAAGAVVFAASLVLMQISGVQGIILRQFAVVFAATGVAAVLNGIVVVPAFSQLLLGGARAAAEETDGSPRTAVPGAAWVGFAVAAALGLAAFALMDRTPKDLVPNEDLGLVLVDFKTREGTTTPVVREILKRAFERMNAVADIERSCTVFGEGIFSPSAENTAKSYLVLRPWSERGRNDSTPEVIARLRKAVADIPEVQITFMTQATVPGIGTATGVNPLVLAVGHNDPKRLADEAHRLREILKRSPLADTVTCGYNTDAPHLRITVDRAKCELMKVPLSSLFTTLQHYLGSVYVNDVNLGTQVNRVTLMCDWKGRAAPDAMAGLFVRSTAGAMVPVSSLVSYEEELGPQSIYRYNRYIYCTVDFGQKAGVSIREAMDEVAGVFARELPRDFATGWTGLAYEESCNAGQMEMMITLAILMAYLVMLVRFESWRRAFLAMLPSVAAVFGGVLLLYLTGVSLSLYSRLALVMLFVFSSAFTLLDGPDASWKRLAVLPLMGALMALPMLFSSGAGAIGSRSLGMTLVGGYLGFAFIGIPLRRLLSSAIPVSQNQQKG